jgi:hypothetical protein
MTTKITQQTFEQALHQELDGVPATNGDVGWDDLTNSISGRKLTASTGLVDTNWDNSSVTFNPGADIDKRNERILIGLQKMHSMPEPGGEMRLHIHWEQTTSDNIIWTVQYRIQNTGGIKTDSWTTPENFESNTHNIFPYTDGTTLNQITKLCTVDLTGTNLSSTVQFRIARTDNVNMDVEATFVDAHINTDQPRGSREEFSK